MTDTQPPGQLELFRPTPGTTARSWRIVTRHLRTRAMRSLPVAAGNAASAATQHGEAWLIASDHSTAHIHADGTVNPTTGWAALAARIITRTRT